MVYQSTALGWCVWIGFYCWQISNIYKQTQSESCEMLVSHSSELRRWFHCVSKSLIMNQINRFQSDSSISNHTNCAIKVVAAAALSLHLSPSISLSLASTAGRQTNKQKRREKQQRWPLKILENVAHVYFNRKCHVFKIHGPAAHTHIQTNQTLRLNRCAKRILNSWCELFAVIIVAVFIDKLHKDVNCVWRRVIALCLRLCFDHIFAAERKIPWVCEINSRCRRE